ncbi:MAG: hypothetical protein JW786_07780 [Desulfobacterales bacterium]|nr:hypothetical protein [Desulfobacterales bacterium]
MKKSHSGFFISFLTALSMLAVFSSIVCADPAKRIFIVHSYEQNHICGQPQHDGAMNALEKTGWVVGKNIGLSVYYMDTKRKNNTPELIAQQAELVLKEIEHFRPDVILTLDDNAFKTVALPLSGKPVNIVFSGMNGQPEDYNRSRHFMESRAMPGGNITGVYEKLHIREAIQVFSTMCHIKKTLILDDLSPTGKAVAKQVELELKPDQNEEPLPCVVEKQTLRSWEEFQQIVDVINSTPEIGAFYLGTLLLKDAAGRTYTANEVIDYTIKNARKPAIGPNYSFIKLGLLGGASVDFFAMGQQAGLKVAKVLSGAAPGILPIEDAHKVALVFNLARSKTLGIEIPTDILMAADEVFRK